MRKKSEHHLFNHLEDLVNVGSFYLVGIGGSGMAPLAKLLHHKGYKVAGSDKGRTKFTDELQKLGIEISIGHTADHIQPDDAIVFSDAIDLNTSPEYAKSQQLGCKIFRRLLVLSWLIQDKKTIAITGTHGKSTTTALVTAGLKAAGVDPSFLIGAKAPTFGTSVLLNDSEWFVVEACEAYDAYHDLSPHIVLLTNLEADHLDYHETFENLRDSVKRFISTIPADGTLIYCKSDWNAYQLADEFSGNKIAYDENTFENITGISKITIPGEHNMLNAGGAITTVKACGLSIQKAAEEIRDFTGIGRRFEMHLEAPITVIDDYAHHPTAILETIKAARSRYPGKRIIYVFQPHLYSSTSLFKKEFAQALSTADHVVITDIFHSREEPVPGVSALLIAQLLTKPFDYIPCRHLLPRHVKSIANDGDVVIGSGVGNIGEMGPALAAEYQRKGPAKVTVIYGGDSPEREVALHSGRRVYDSLLKKGYDAKLVDLSDLLLSTGDLSQFIGPNRPDLIFSTVPGVRAEDGCYQGLFEMLHIPQVFGGVLSSAIAFNKQVTKDFLQTKGILSPYSVRLTAVPDSFDHLPFPAVVKPNAQGSTIGVKFVRDRSEFREAMEYAFRYDKDILVEQLIEGIELTVPVLIDRALPVIEIIPNSGIFDYEAKYVPDATNEIIPARLPKDVYDRVQKLAVQIHHLLDCKGCSRSDFIYDGENLYFIEINTPPGMTSTSLVPNALKAANIPFEDFCAELVEDALERACKNGQRELVK